MGYEVEPGNYVLLDKDELDAVRLETRHTIELTQFVDDNDIDPLYFERPYYLLPDGDVAEEAILSSATRCGRRARSPSANSRCAGARTWSRSTPAARAGARHPALRGRDQGRRRGVLVARQGEAARGHARNGQAADREPQPVVRPLGVQEPLRRGLARSRQAQGRQRRHGADRGRGGAGGQGHRLRGGAETLAVGRRGEGEGRRSRRRAKRRKPAAKRKAAPAKKRAAAKSTKAAAKRKAG